MASGLSLSEAVNKVLSSPNGGKKLDPRTLHPVEYRGILYESKKSLLEAFDLTWKDIWYSIKKGTTFYSAIDKVLAKRNSLYYKGKQYNSVKAAAEDLGISYSVLSLHFKVCKSLKLAVEEHLNHQESKKR
jgi:hypothetical protein